MRNSIGIKAICVALLIIIILLCSCNKAEALLRIPNSLIISIFKII